MINIIPLTNTLSICNSCNNKNFSINNNETHKLYEIHITKINENSNIIILCKKCLSQLVIDLKYDHDIKE